MKTLFSTSIRTAVVGLILVAPMVLGHPTTAIAGQTSTSDNKLKDRIDYRLETSSVVKKYDLHVKVDAGVVMLKGNVATAAQKSEAGTLAKITGVSEVNNQIAIDPDADKTLADRAKTGVRRSGEAVTDAWITTKVKWFHTNDELLDGSRIDVDTNKRIVTLTGTVKTAEAKTRAISLANHADGVTSVVDHLTVVK
jgi:osmotically-inducible protein OsmY